MSKSISNYVGNITLQGEQELPNQPLNAAITQPVTVGVNVTYPAVIATRDISYVIECIRTGVVEGKDIRALILTIRNMPNAELAKAMKAQLPYFLGSHCERRRANSNVKSARFIIFDLDHVEDPELLKETALNKLPFLRYAFRSVRDGVKLIAELGTPVTNENAYRLIWKYLALQVEHALGMSVDATPDWCRACFFSFDPGLLYNSSCKPVDVRKAAVEAALVNQLCSAVKYFNGAAGVSPAKDIQGSTLANPYTGAAGVSPAKDEQGSTLAKSGQAGTLAAPTYQPTEDDYTRAETIVRSLAQIPIAYSDWVRIGMALYAGFGEQGRRLWDIFLTNPNYQDTEAELAKHWRSFATVRSITLSTLFFVGEKYGCQA